MRSAVDVSDEAVEQMLEESLEHAFSDMSERQFTEAKMKADDLLAAIQSAYAKLGTDLPDADRAEVDALVAEVQAAIQSRSVSALKKANEALDRGTEHLATLLIEQAMR
jgi:molecular chaperone DnaK